MPANLTNQGQEKGYDTSYRARSFDTHLTLVSRANRCRSAPMKCHGAALTHWSNIAAPMALHITVG